LVFVADRCVDAHRCVVRVQAHWLSIPIEIRARARVGIAWSRPLAYVLSLKWHERSVCTWRSSKRGIHWLAANAMADAYNTPAKSEARYGVRKKYFFASKM